MVPAATAASPSLRPAGGAERRGFFRGPVQLKSILSQVTGEGLRSVCRIDNLGAGGCSLHVGITQPLSAEVKYRIRFALPSRQLPLSFDAKLVHAETESDGEGQKARFRFLNPPIGLQDAIVFYLNNRQSLCDHPVKLAVPVSLETQRGLRRFIRYRGHTDEVGSTYAVCHMPQLGLANTSEVLATFLAPRSRDEISQEAVITGVKRNPSEGYRVRIEFVGAEQDHRLQDFIRQHYGQKMGRATTS